MEGYSKWMKVPQLSLDDYWGKNLALLEVGKFIPLFPNGLFIYILFQ